MASVSSTRVIPKTSGYGVSVQRFGTIKGESPEAQESPTWHVVAEVSSLTLGNDQIEALIGWHNRLLLDKELSFVQMTQ